ncbi:MAG: hypothetical protein GY822_20570 [Deltaproteobacteria bacterium]|nr:hypothetical protein [Deltaproteobacteria bacterium]
MVISSLRARDLLDFPVCPDGRRHDHLRSSSWILDKNFDEADLERWEKQT